MTSSTNALLEVRNLCTTLGNTTIHDNLSISIEKGKIYAIVGGSGAGKSVLIKTILGLITPASGEILFEGKSRNLEELRRKSGVQFQNGALLSALTAGENVMLPLQYKAGLPTDYAQEIALSKLKLVGLDESVFHKYPSMLSGGMIKRVSLARAIALDPVILFLDEPTSGLDPLSAQSYDELILNIHSNLKITVIMITHDLLRVRNLSDGVIIIDQKKAYQGSFEALAADKNVGKYLHGF